MSTARSAPQAFDHVLVGGGLAGGLIALALLELRPGESVALIERGARPGGQHTWCFHAGDVPAAARAFVEPLVEHRWDGYEVRFPGLSRRLESPYFGLSSTRLAEVLEARFAARPDCALWASARVTSVRARSVALADGRELTGRLVVDARGPSETPPVGSAGFQKFVGLELELERDHGLERPVVMDATVEQQDGFRFFYVLPLGPRRVLIEDTRFADGPELDVPALRAEIEAYAHTCGVGDGRVRREERGVLPMPWRGHALHAAGPPLVAGYRGGWLHPATGYSFPLAVRVAQLVAENEPERLFDGPLRALAREYRGPAQYARLLNRMLFRWFAPGDRRNVFERFHRLPEPVIRRFYALRPTWTDRARVLVGRPPRGMSLRARLRSRVHAGAAAAAAPSRSASS